MEAIILLCVVFSTATGGYVFTKLNSNALIGTGHIGYAVLLFSQGLVATFFFLAFTGFTLELDWKSVLLAVVFCFFCIASCVTNMIAYRLADVASIDVTRNSMSLICTTVMGVVLFDEIWNRTKAIRIATMLLAAFMVFLQFKCAIIPQPRSSKPTRSRARVFSGIFLTTAIFVAINCYTTLQSRLIAQNSLVPDMNSFFFVTNVAMCGCSLFWILISYFKKPSMVKECLAMLKPKSFACMVGGILCSNVNSIAGVLILKYMDISVFSPVSSALAILGSAATSLIFRERIGKFSFVSIILAIVAVII